MYTQKSFTLNASDAQKKWWIVDAQDLVVGRLATNVANLLRGKHRPTYTPNTDSGDFVVVINSDKVKFTGNKLEAKKYWRHTGFVGGIKSRTAKEQLERDSRKVIESAVRGMLPKTSLGRKQLTKLKVFTGPEHSHEAQKPETFKLS